MMALESTLFCFFLYVMFSSLISVWQNVLFDWRCSFNLDLLLSIPWMVLWWCTMQFVVICNATAINFVRKIHLKKFLKVDQLNFIHKFGSNYILCVIFCIIFWMVYIFSNARRSEWYSTMSDWYLNYIICTWRISNLHLKMNVWYRML